MNSESDSQGRVISLVSYMWLFGVIIAFYLNNDKKFPLAQFHIRQSLGLWLTFMTFGYIVGYFDNWGISISFLLFFGVLFFYAFMTAATGKSYPVPIVGNFYQKIFANLGS